MGRQIKKSHLDTNTYLIISIAGVNSNQALKLPYLCNFAQQALRTNTYHCHAIGYALIAHQAQLATFNAGVLSASRQSHNSKSCIDLSRAMEAPPYSDSPRPWTLISRKKYFIAYNGVSLALWATITLRAIAIMALLIPTTHLYVLHEALHPLLTVTQSLAILEIIHSLVGIVRASPLTTLLQIASRLFLVWGVVGLFPEVVANKRIFGDRVQHYPGAPGGSLAYAGILMAWGITECVRYSFFVWKECLGNDRVPSWLIWLR